MTAGIDGAEVAAISEASRVQCVTKNVKAEAARKGSRNETPPMRVLSFSPALKSDGSTSVPAMTTTASRRGSIQPSSKLGRENE
jgi:hypothetical protein